MKNLRKQTRTVIDCARLADSLLRYSRPIPATKQNQVLLASLRRFTGAAAIRLSPPASLHVFFSFLQGVNCGHMKNIKQEIGTGPVSKNDVRELVLEPLSSLIDHARLEMLKKIQDLAEDVEMIARQLSRCIEKAPTKKEDGDL